MLTLKLHVGPPDAVWGRQVDVWWGFSSDTDLILRNFLGIFMMMSLLMILPVLFDQRMLGQVALTLSRRGFGMLCHGRDHSFLSMAQYGAKRS